MSTTINDRPKTTKPKTLLQHIEQIIEFAENSKLNDDFHKKAKSSIGFVAKTMNLTINQAILFSLFMEKSSDSSILISEICSFLGARIIKAVSMMNDADGLEMRRLVRCSREKGGRITYRVPREVINAVQQNVTYTPESTLNLNTDGVFKHIDRLFEEKENNEISFVALVKDLRALLDDNATLLFCQQMKEYEKICKGDNFLLLLLFCHRFINLNDDHIVFSDFEDLFDRKWNFRNIKSELQNGESELIRNSVLEYVNDNGYADNEAFRISATAKEKLFAEINLKVKQAENKKGLILHQDIVPKQLFYNERERAQIIQLSSLLRKENFASVQEKLEKSGLRKGFACLFYGAPGSGKTETAYQIAHSTGRDIMMVDISETKSMWYGESEKRIKGIFETYRSRLKTSQIAPILLFNEADAVIGKRKEAGKSSIDQTENAIQNIILQEMENLDGIMIATTNLTQNLDKAFERRFLYKIEFCKPNVEAKEKIWESLLPKLTKSERMELAGAYSFSGGQIENIVRKYTVDCILNGTEPSIDAVHEYCQTEFLYKNEEKRKIGFIL
jgi:AAA+ superfamily predicted ATPase